VPDRDEEHLLDELAIVFARVALEHLIEERDRAESETDRSDAACGEIA
jgi:hypothetical protein